MVRTKAKGTEVASTNPSATPDKSMANFYPVVARQSWWREAITARHGLLATETCHPPE